MDVRDYGNWIDGAWQSAGELIERFSPASGELVARYSRGNAAHIDSAVEAARSAFNDRQLWSGLPGGERGKCLAQFANALEPHIERLAEIEAWETGKPKKFARGEVEFAIEILRYAGALAWQIPGDLVSNIGDQSLGMVVREPRGVVALITPWNYPIVTLMQKLAYALAAGCTAVVKPSELTSGTALELAAIAAEAGIPKGVINVVTGFGSEAGQSLIGHKDIDMVSFTGSTATGRGIAANASASMKRVGLELGGKAANIVLEDCDFEAALDGVLFGYVLNQGEECCQGARLIIQESIADEFLKCLVERSRRIRVGPPSDAEADMGALISEQHLSKVLHHMDLAIKEGAKLETGGERLRAGHYSSGYYVPPTIFSNVTSKMSLFREEVFGPVLSVTTFKTIGEAIDLANDTSYGLYNGVWTKNIDAAIMISRALKSGTVNVNTYLESAVQLPFGGWKESGIGRENGLDGLLEFTEAKSIFVKLGARDPVFPHTVPVESRQM